MIVLPQLTQFRCGTPPPPHFVGFSGMKPRASYMLSYIASLPEGCKGETSVLWHAPEYTFREEVSRLDF